MAMAMLPVFLRRKYVLSAVAVLRAFLLIRATRLSPFSAHRRPRRASSRHKQMTTVMAMASR